MSEPARHLPQHETAGRPAPGPLRDWLAAMKAQTPHAAMPQAATPHTASPVQAEPAAAPRAVQPEIVRTPEPTRTVEPARGGEPTWSPRVVQAAEAPRPAPEADDEDVSELVAENLMLKAKLRLESERYGDLQAILAQEVRDLRLHVRSEMEALDTVRAEREQFRAERDRLQAERDQFRAERDGVRAERDEVRAECELWHARAEALAQPLFQKR